MTAGSARALTSAAGGNQPAAPQQIPAASSSSATGFSLGNGSPTLEGHADQIRSSISDVMGTQTAGEESTGALTVAAQERWRLADSVKLMLQEQHRESQARSSSSSEKRTECASLQPGNMDRLPCRPDRGGQHRGSS